MTTRRVSCSGLNRNVFESDNEAVIVTGGTCAIKGLLINHSNVVLRGDPRVVLQPRSSSADVLKIAANVDRVLVDNFTILQAALDGLYLSDTDIVGNPLDGLSIQGSSVSTATFINTTAIGNGNDGFDNGASDARFLCVSAVDNGANDPNKQGRGIRIAGVGQIENAHIVENRGAGVAGMLGVSKSIRIVSSTIVNNGGDAQIDGNATSARVEVYDTIVAGKGRSVNAGKARQEPGTAGAVPCRGHAGDL